MFISRIDNVMRSIIFVYLGTVISVHNPYKKKVFFHSSTKTSLHQCVIGEFLDRGLKSVLVSGLKNPIWVGRYIQLP